MVEIRNTPPPQNPTVPSDHLVSNEARTAAVATTSPETRESKSAVFLGPEGNKLGDFRSLIGGLGSRRTG